MFTFNYKARNNAGQLVTGVIEAFSPSEAADKLQYMEYTPVEISQKADDSKQTFFEEKFKRIKTEDIVMFNVQLSNMLNAGLSLTNSLDILQKQISNKKFNSIVTQISDDIKAGESFSQAVSKHSKVFSELFISMIKASEKSGDLGGVLNKYALFAEAQAELLRKVREALCYPTILISGAIGVIVFMATCLIPKFVEIFERAGIDLPLPTVILYGFGTGIRQYWYLIILFIAAAIFGFRKYVKTDSGGFIFDKFVLKIPMLGMIFRKINISRFTGTLSTMISSGVPILESLNTARDVVNNKVIGGVIAQVERSVEKGISLADSLRVSEEFPVDTVQMISVGEESGELANMLQKISEFYDRSTGYSIKKMVSGIEPILLVVMGVIVAFTMASMLFPMFDMVKVLKR